MGIFLNGVYSDLNSCLLFGVLRYFGVWTYIKMLEGRQRKSKK